MEFSIFASIRLQIIHAFLVAQFSQQFRSHPAIQTFNVHGGVATSCYLTFIVFGKVALTANAFAGGDELRDGPSSLFHLIIFA